MQEPSSESAPDPVEEQFPHIPRARGAQPRWKRWTSIERELRALKGPLLAGVDEVGRGPIAGPVVACAVIMPADEPAIRGVDDSKKLTAEEREKLAPKIRAKAIAFGIGAASVHEIDTINIYQASRLAMTRALSRLSVTPNHVIIDGNRIRTLPVAHTPVPHGDARCYSIACASILAKVTRDYLMTRLAVKYPAYTWDHNAGYTTRAHVAGLISSGITPHHRRSFTRINELLAQLERQGDIEAPISVTSEITS
jgi:ribonuclease HII